jgi:hypothetical protein
MAEEVGDLLRGALDASEGIERGAISGAESEIRAGVEGLAENVTRGELGVDMGVSEVTSEGRVKFTLDGIEGEEISAAQAAEAAQDFAEGKMISGMEKSVGEDLTNRVLPEGSQTRQLFKEAEAEAEKNFKGQTEFAERQATPDISPEEKAQTGNSISEGERVAPESTQVVYEEAAKPGPITEENIDSINDQVRNNPEEARAINEIVDNDPILSKIKNKLLEGAKKLGRFVEENIGTLVKLLIAGGIGLFVWYLVKKHQHAVNGCWYYPNNGDKKPVKVTDFSCNKADQDNTESGRSETCSQLQVGAKCTGCDCNDSGSGSCSNCCSCGTGGQDCSKGSFSCVKKNPAEAAADLATEPFEAGGNLLSNIIKIILRVLKWVGILLLVLLGFFILFMIIKFVWGMITKKRENKKSEKAKPASSQRSGSRDSSNDRVKVTYKKVSPNTTTRKASSSKSTRSRQR